MTTPFHAAFAGHLRACPLVAILRGITPDETPAVCEALYAAGLRLLEIPLNSPDACAGIRRAAQRMAGRMLVGAGTVLTPDDARRVADVGGAFIISPNVDAEVIQASKTAGLVSVPGFFTPTEAFAALKAGADYLKLFPAGRMGVDYIKDLKAVVQASILAVGGVNPDNLASFLAVCAGAGVGGALFHPGQGADEIRRRAEVFVRRLPSAGPPE